eukprot:TRINITY_DN9149_c0_g1_i1.p1 TRINITY_DN9149_c0_g1~~TRINITY_DN9149_c0_g1_i1.p1  ORF type:complete len:953 (+),score=250.47 TRINITY_DN9149_c0_g1_i1:99-2957(+)
MLTCAFCNLPVTSKYVMVEGKPCHSQCLTCSKCYTDLVEGSQLRYTMKEGKPYCRDCAQKFFTLCAECGKTCFSKYISALGKIWHSYHFTCAQCGDMLESYVAVGQRAYCEPCATKVTGKKVAGTSVALKKDTLQQVTTETTQAATPPPSGPPTTIATPTTPTTTTTPSTNSSTNKTNANPSPTIEDKEDESRPRTLVRTSSSRITTPSPGTDQISPRLMRRKSSRVIRVALPTTSEDESAPVEVKLTPSLTPSPTAGAGASGGGLSRTASTSAIRLSPNTSPRAGLDPVRFPSLSSLSPQVRTKSSRSLSSGHHSLPSPPTTPTTPSSPAPSTPSTPITPAGPAPSPSHASSPSAKTLAAASAAAPAKGIARKPAFRKEKPVVSPSPATTLSSASHTSPASSKPSILRAATGTPSRPQLDASPLARVQSSRSPSSSPSHHVSTSTSISFPPAVREANLFADPRSSAHRPGGTLEGLLGVSLHFIVEGELGRALTPVEVWAVLHGVAEHLFPAHAARTTHRHLRSDTIFIDREGSVRVAGTELPWDDPRCVRVRAPELTNPHDTSIAADVYALGSTLELALAGGMRDDRTPSDIMATHASSGSGAGLTLLPILDDLIPVLASMTSPDPSSRPPMLTLLRDCAMYFSPEDKVLQKLYAEAERRSLLIKKQRMRKLYDEAVMQRAAQTRRKLIPEIHKGITLKKPPAAKKMTDNPRESVHEGIRAYSRSRLRPAPRHTKAANTFGALLWDIKRSRTLHNIRTVGERSLATLLRPMANHPRYGTTYRDVLPLLRHPRSMLEVVDACVTWLEGVHDQVYQDQDRFLPLTLVCLPNEPAIALAARVASRAGCPLVVLQRTGRIPRNTERHSETYDNALTGLPTELQVPKNILRQGEKVVIVDDILDNGHPLDAALSLMHQGQCEVVACLCLVELTSLGGRKTAQKVPNLHTLYTFSE